jgi:Fic family protein
VESSLEGAATAGDHLAEIANIEEAMAYIESVMQPGAEVSEHFIRELHALAVRNLVR